MNRSEAREHLELADQIVAASTRELSLRQAAPFFVAWGLASGSTCIIYELIERGIAPASAQWVAGALLLAAVVYSIVCGRYSRAKGGMTFLEREFLNVLWIAMGVAFVANLGGFNIFPVFGMSAIWTVAASIVLFYIGLHANRRATVGGIILIGSLIIGNFMPSFVGYALAAGFYLGYAGFGVAELLARA